MKLNILAEIDIDLENEDIISNNLEDYINYIFKSAMDFQEEEMDSGITVINSEILIEE